MGFLTLRQDARMVVLRKDHRLAGRPQLRVEDVLDETFYGTYPSIDPAWAAFWSLDEDRGGPPESLTGEEACNTMELVAAMAGGRAITTCPEPVAALIVEIVPDLLALPLIDAAPASCVLAWHLSRRSSAVDELTEIARGLKGAEAVDQPKGGRPRRVARGGHAHRVLRAAAPAG